MRRKKTFETEHEDCLDKEDKTQIFPGGMVVTWEDC